MTDLYLIAHKVRGAPAFDIAEHMTCPHCDGCGRGDFGESAWCHACDGAGHWWIIPTSGHRAFPYWHEAIGNLRRDDGYDYYEINPGEMPPDLRDHYTAEKEIARSLIDVLGLIHAPLVQPPIKRRF